MTPILVEIVLNRTKYQIHLLADENDI